MSIVMTTAVYVINWKAMFVFKAVPTMAVFVSKNIKRYDAYDKKIKVGIDMGATENSHSQQYDFGCVDDEANILKKCDARRQVVSDNDLFSHLPRELYRVLTSVLTAMYQDLLRGEQVDDLAAVYEGLLTGEQADVCTFSSSVLRAVVLFWHECLVILPCSWIRQVYLELGNPAIAIAATPIMKQRKKVSKTIGNQKDKKNKKSHSFP